MKDGSALAADAIVAIVGAGTMGAGIAQVAAAAGHRVLLHDARPKAADAALEAIARDLGARVAKGRLDGVERDAIVSRIIPTPTLGEMIPASLVVEAIVEDLAAKQALFRALEGVVGTKAILATNTSSLSVTAIAAALERPERFAGFHFFNPAPAMRLVEVVAGAASGSEVLQTLTATARAWGKRPIRARSTPGFVANRVARPFYAEALRLLEEGIAGPEDIDATLVAAGFRMGPLALMDLIGHDVNYAVTAGVFEAFAYDPRYRPSLRQKELVDAGWLGRKTGRGFYAQAPAREAAPPRSSPPALMFDGRELMIAGIPLVPTDGRLAVTRERAEGRALVLYDLTAGQAATVSLCPSPGVGEAGFGRVCEAVAADGRRPVRLNDRPGLLAMRTVAMLVNEAYEAELTGVAAMDDIDAAMTDGFNHPCGPARFAERLGHGTILSVLDHIQAATGDPRYRASLGLRLAAETRSLGG